MADNERTRSVQAGRALIDDEREESMIRAMAYITEACVKLREAGRTVGALRFEGFINERFSVEEKEKLAAAGLSARQHGLIEIPPGMDANTALVYQAITMLISAGAEICQSWGL